MLRRYLLSFVLFLSCAVTNLYQPGIALGADLTRPNTDLDYVTTKTIHVVQAGQNLFRISLQYGVSVQNIMSANGMSSHIVYVGQKLIIPNSDDQTNTPVPTQPQPIATGGNKSIYVSLSKQRVYLYENGQQIRNYIASTGMNGSTRAGNYKVQTKMLEAFANTWQLRMPYWLGIYYVGRLENGFHALPINRYGQTMWAGYLGRPASYGCIVLSTADAKNMYLWADMGTSVSIRW